MIELCKLAAKQNRQVFLLGAQNKTAQKVAEELRTKYQLTKIEYSEEFDYLSILTSDGYTEKKGIYLHRAYGNVGIGGCNWGNTYKLRVYGDAYASGFWLGSDERIKTNITKIGSNKNEKFNLLEAVSYNLIKEPNSVKSSQSTNEKIYNDTLSKNYIKDSIIQPEKTISGLKYGFIAQEVRKIFPELVSEDSKGYLAIDYIGFIPLLIESYKDQQKSIKYLNSEVTELKDLISSISSDCCKNNLKKGELTEDNISTYNQTILFQNSPNPFQTETTIEYYISENSKETSLFIYNLQGKELKKVPISIKGKGNVVIKGSEFEAGMYIYSLIVDGVLIDTKTMVLTK